MNYIINNIITGLNNIGFGFCDYAVSMFIQSSVLIVLLLIIDFILRKRVRAVFRYCIWMLVFVKLILPASFTLPTGVGYWLSDYWPKETIVSVVKQQPTSKQAVPVTVPVKSVVTSPEVTTPVESVPAANKTVPNQFRLEAISSQAIIFTGWIVGVLVLSALLIQRVFFVRALIAQSKPAKGRLLETLEQCRSQFGVRKKVQLRLSDNSISPAVCGLFKPIILMPTGLLEKLSREKLQAVLIHELAHIKRADIWVNLVQTLLQIAYFYNPFVWLANMMVRRIREQAVDEMVLVSLKQEAKTYSNTLIDIGEMAFLRPNLSLRLVGVVESKKALQRRIKHMLSRPIPKTAKLGIAGLLAVIVLGCAVLPMAKAKDSVQRGLDSGQEMTEKSEFKATLPNGVTVELVGLGTAPWESEQTWWRPDGTKRNKPEFKFKAHLLPWPKDPNRPQFVCAALLEFSNHAGKSVSVPAVKFPAHTPILTAGRCGKVTYIVSNPDFGKVPDKTDIRLAANTAGFKKAKRISHFTAKQLQAYYLEDNSSVILHPIRIDRDIGTLTVDLTCPEKEYEFRVLAELKDGSTEQWHGGSFGNVKFFHATPRRKNIKVEDIKQLIIEYRPYQWVTFKNVSLKPNFKTDVQIEVEKSGHLSQGAVTALPATSGNHTQIQLLNSLFHILKEAYEKKDWAMVNTIAESIRDVFRDNEEFFTEQIGRDMAYRLEELSDELHDSIRDEELYLTPAYYEQLIKTWGEISKNSDFKTAGEIVHPIEFEITNQQFLQGDSIEITEILGSADKIETGRTYTIKGKYKLSSHNQAMLHIYATNGQTHSKQGPVVNSGTGDFTRTFTYQKDGWLHLSFYPAEGGGSFGNLYFAQKGSGQKVPDLANITSVVGDAKPSEQKPKAAKILLIEVDENGDEGPKDVSLRIPLAGLTVANTLIPKQAQRQMNAYGITLEEIIKKVEDGLEPTVLLEVKEKNKEVRISLE